jgi:hypothetical protein
MPKTLASLALVFSLVMPARALCGHPGPRLLCAEYFQEDAVVIAQVVKSRPVPNADDVDYTLYTMNVERVLRGRISPRFRVIQGNDSGRVGFPWEKGESYLLFISYKKEYKAWALDGCSNSGPIELVAETLKSIEQLRAGGHGGTIQGLVWPDAGATVTARGTTGVFKATTSEEGEFEIHVPAGEYRVSVRHAGKRFEPDFLSYEDPRRLRVRNGGCAQVQFLVSDRK